MARPAALLTALFLCGCAAAGPPRASSPIAPVLARYAAWHGGAGAIERIHFLSYDFDMWDKGKTYVVRFAGSRAGLVRVDAYAKGRQIVSEGIDDEGGWTWRPGQASPQAASEQGTAALRHGLAFNVLFLNQLPALGHEVVLLDGPQRDGERGVKVTLNGGFQSQLFLDASTGKLLRKKDRSSLHPDIDPSQQWFETSFSEFVELNGVKLWTRSETRDVATGQVVMRIVRRNFAFAPPVHDLFDRSRRAAPQL